MNNYESMQIYQYFGGTFSRQREDSIKMHYLFSHLDRFPENLADVSVEKGERFHQDIKKMETLHQGRWNNIIIIADYCWSIKRETSEPQYSSRAKTNKFIT